MVDLITGKAEYTEEEAAATLGVSISDLRTMVRTHVIKEEGGSDAPITTFRPTDLLLLKMLSSSQTHASRAS
jgi:hypothetical protein